MQTPDLDAVLVRLRADADAGRLDHWGFSTAVDENVGRPVITQPLFDALHAAARLPAAFPVGNAGVIHVYGYWFSTEPTPYGYKRDRWVDGRLAVALGLPASAFLLDSDPRTTPLQRVTEAALPVLLRPPVDALAVIEQVVGDGRTRAVLTRATDAGTAALVYGVDTGSGLRLVTTFPFDGDPAALAREFDAEPPRLRFNAAGAGAA